MLSRNFFLELDWYLRLNFVAILITKTYQLTGYPTLKMSLLIFTSSVCIPAVTIYTHNNLLHFATFIIIISPCTSFFSTHSIEVLDAFNIPTDLANVAAFCFSKLITNHVLISKWCTPQERSDDCKKWKDCGISLIEDILHKVRKCSVANVYNIIIDLIMMVAIQVDKAS